MNREAWLDAAATSLRSVFRERAGVTLPPAHVSVGWPSRGGTSTKKRIVGQCWQPETSADGTPHIFISPVISDGFEVLAILVHELVHAVHPKAKHNGDFITTARAMGLEKPWTSSTAGDDLAPVLERLLTDLGEFPHAQLTPITKAQKPQTTRQLKVEAVTCCGYIARTTKKWLEDVGLPKCPHGEEMERT